MIKILKPDVIAIDVWQCTCRQCKCEFEFERQDAKFNHDQRDGDFFTIGCPTCGNPCTKQVKDKTVRRSN